MQSSASPLKTGPCNKIYYEYGLYGAANLNIFRSHSKKQLYNSLMEPLELPVVQLSWDTR